MSRPDAVHPTGIADALRAKISAGEYPEGSKLPGEIALAEQLGASRSTVRRAVAELGREGLVSAARGRGTFVRIRPDRRVVLIDDRAEREDLLAAAFEPARRGWIPVWPARFGPSGRQGLGPGQQAQASTQPTQPTQRGGARSRRLRVVGCDQRRAEALGLRPKQPVVLREQRWRHQENGSLIAVSSCAAADRLSALLDAAPDGYGGAHRSEADLYDELVRAHGPAAFATTVRARMPSARERDELELESGVPLLVITRVMYDPCDMPMEATTVHAPADRFEAAHCGRRPILCL